MRMTIKQTNDAIKAVRKEMLKALENASNKVLAIFPQAESDPEAAHLVFNIVGSQAHESLDLFLRQFAQGLDASLGDAWMRRAEEEINTVVAELRLAHECMDDCGDYRHPALYLSSGARLPPPQGPHKGPHPPCRN